MDDNEPYDLDDIAAEIEAAILPDDDSEAREILASGHFIVICKPDTPPGFVTRVYPDGHEELDQVDMSSRRETH
jgi:hypothetical protein